MRGPGPGKRRLALAAPAALALAAAGWLGWAWAEAPVDVSAPPPTALPERPDAPPLLASPSQGAAPGRAELADAWREMPRPGSLAEVAARDYRERARFPQWSHALEGGTDPLLRDRQVTSAHSFPLGAEPVLWAEPERSSFQAPAPVVLFARLEEDGERVRASRIRGEVRTAAEETVAELRFRDDGREGDAAEDDRLYTARLDPAELEDEALSGSYLVQVEAVAAGGAERTAATGFLYSVPRSELTGRFQDSRAAGSLVVEAEVEVYERSRFHLEATLGSASGEPLAWAQHATTLDPGLHWMPLTFYGLALSQSGEDGPYHLLSVGLSTTGRMPNHPNELLRSAHVTRAYEASDFTAEPYGDPDLLRAAERLEAGADASPDAGALDVGPR